MATLRRRLGRTDIEVSALCLGSMTWGTQNTAEEGAAQIDRALERGVDFIDTAEMYPTNPARPETVGRTEEILGRWVAQSGRRGDVVIATKVLGEGTQLARGGAPVTGATMRAALEGSLRRLRTDMVDLYQLHWPNRGSYHFRRYWSYDATEAKATRAETRAHIEDMLETADALIREGKMRAFGLSNETAWGVAQWLEIAERDGLPRVASVQNEYSLLCRGYDLDLAELSHHEDVGLLAYSPLAAGMLTGKYAGGAIPEGSRASINPTLNGRMVESAHAAVDAYGDVARRHGLDPTQMALAWCLTRPFMASVIFGATSLAQLDVALGAADLTLSQEALDDVQAVYRRWPAPI